LHPRQQFCLVLRLAKWLTCLLDCMIFIITLLACAEEGSQCISRDADGSSTWPNCINKSSLCFIKRAGGRTDGRRPTNLYALLCILLLRLNEVLRLLLLKASRQPAHDRFSLESLATMEDFFIAHHTLRIFHSLVIISAKKEQYMTIVLSQENFHPATGGWWLVFGSGLSGLCFTSAQCRNELRLSACC
jgi:hypothetical protein